MITLTRPAYYSARRYNQYCGLSTDDKTVITAGNADEYYEIDTGLVYIYNGASGEWVEQPTDNEPIDTGIPTMTSETAGQFLSNDGLVTHWQSIASKNFIINLTESDEGGSYTADKTYVQIKAAYDGEENIVVRVGNSELPLMIAEFADNGDAGLVFGYTDIRTAGQLIVTRAISYTHIGADDAWTDADASGEYLSINGGTMVGDLFLAGAPIDDYQAANKQYVDNLISGCVLLKTAPTGQLKAYVQNGDKQDSLIVTTSPWALCLVRYTTGGQVATNAPTANNHAANKEYVDAQLSASTSDVCRKASITVGANSSVNVPLSNGVYLVTVADDMHGGLLCISVFDSGMTINGLVGVNNWTCERVSGSNTISITNTAPTDMTIYITSVGEGSYR